MTGEILAEIRNLVKEATGIDPMLVEPDFSNPMSYPCSWLDFEETPWEGTQQLTKRSATITIFLADRCLASDANNRMLELIESANRLDKAIIQTRQVGVGEKKAQIRLRSTRAQSVRELGSGFVLLGVLVQIQAIYDQEV